MVTSAFEYPGNVKRDYEPFLRNNAFYSIVCVFEWKNKTYVQKYIQTYKTMNAVFHEAQWIH